MDAFPGGTSVSFLTVYDTEAPDGIRGGTPHLHTASTEAYVVVGGRGALHTIDASGFRETPLEAGVVVWFTPGTVHRAVNVDDLRVVCIMKNSGLPEAGDAVMCFPDHILADAEAYRAAAALPPGTGQDTAEAARARRDLGVEGFTALRSALDGGDEAALTRLHDRAAALVRPRLDTWRGLWRDGPLADAERTGVVLDSLAGGSAETLAAAAVHEADPHAGDERFGMCGRLRTYDVAGPVAD